MKREEILALNLKEGERIFLEVNVRGIDTESLDDKTICLKDGVWVCNDAIHSIRRVEKTELPEDEQPTVESNYVSLEEFHKRNQFARRIYAFQVAREFAEKGEEMPDDLRNEIMAYISKSPEEETEIKGVDYVLDIDGNKIRVGDEVVKERYHETFRGRHIIEKIKDGSVKFKGHNSMWDSTYFRKVN